MSDTLFSQNPWYSADIIRGYKPDFTPRVAFILGSGLGRWRNKLKMRWRYLTRSCPAFR
ncbi:Xanthosine phosphorylase [Klebsiella grimontii]|nr:Xanthosine phosphorylase [Klebsiella grimontii]